MFIGTAGSDAGEFEDVVDVAVQLHRPLLAPSGIPAAHHDLRDQLPQLRPCRERIISGEFSSEILHSGSIHRCVVRRWPYERLGRRVGKLEFDDLLLAFKLKESLGQRSRHIAVAFDLADDFRYRGLYRYQPCVLSGPFGMLLAPGADQLLLEHAGEPLDAFGSQELVAQPGKRAILEHC
ncbi:hypothetical protein [Polymorphobacter sp. PAMC 29334]|uniref:hypothetical protein n=1 Tax=Polymorphobacter sp. PAMC 29334 TaxID=2862331 RepID=UPI001D016DA6|nr:hypothetical protein [Polymorphobacter sp. PAMC 29334]